MIGPHSGRLVGKAASLTALLFVLLGPLETQAQAEAPRPPDQQVAPRPAQIDRTGVLILIRTTLLALQQANETGNYTVLRDLAAPGFREANDAARLSEIFASQRAQKLDLSGVAVLEPQLTLLPQIEANGLLHMSGFFPSVPNQVNFELLYAPVEGRWRPFGIAVNVGSSTPVAPATPPPAQPPGRPPTAQPLVEKPASKPAAPKPKPSPAQRSNGTPAEKPALEKGQPDNP